MVDSFTLNYKFKFADGEEKTFLIDLDPVTLNLSQRNGSLPPDWTYLDNKKCPNCPLDSKTNPRCPVAVALVEAIDFFKDKLSSDQVDVVVTMPARTHTARQAMSTAVSSLIGIYMVTSGCPILSKLKPMVRTHLPFADLSESLYRFVSMYMLGQYFVYQKGKTPDWDMKGLVSMLDAMRVVNRSFCQRLYAVVEKDASLNALVHLDCFADSTAFAVQKKGLQDLEKTFDAYFTD
ncbi:MAG: hypothetical protein COB53_08235 [Elusimicrobia bacterium]|nr:MAG: hypothetical protein COB53_08235 [Elusimicrobiota bacterium]